MCSDDTRRRIGVTVKKHLRSWGAIYILLALFLGSWTGQLISQSIEFTKEARSHGEAFAWAEA